MTTRKRLFLLALAILTMGLPTVAQTPEATREQCLVGQLDAPVRIDVFSDFQCPSCRSLYQETMRQVLKDYSTQNKLVVVYHEFPLSMHKFAREAARYSVAAQKLGHQQWLAVVESLYADQPKWSEDGSVEATVFKAIANEDFLKLKKILEDRSVNEAIERDIALAKKREVNSTPTLFVNAIGREQKVVGPIPYLVLKDFVDRVVK